MFKINPITVLTGLASILLATRTNGQPFIDTADLEDIIPLDPPEEDYEWFRVGEEVVHTLPSGKQLFATIIDKDTMEQWVRVEYLFNGRVYTTWVGIHDKVRDVYAVQHI